MPSADFFSRLGLYVRQRFLELELCKEICREMRVAPRNLAEVTYASVDRVDELTRKTEIVQVSEKLKTLIRCKLAEIQPHIQTYFNLDLFGFEDPQFLAYKTGDFFAVHTDNSYASDCHEYVKKRQISTVIFLNDTDISSTTNTYTGGALALYGLMQKPGYENFGFDLMGEAGLCVAFPSDTFHEVTPVLQGERFTIVSWFY